MICKTVPKEKMVSLSDGEKKGLGKEGFVGPVLKWVGGKRQLLDTLKPLLPEKITTYCEPFVGGGALLFSLQPKVAYINDINPELMLVYKVIKENVNGLLSELEKFQNTAEEFYAVRDWDRDRKKYDTLTDVQKAARVIFLNKTCYNGLYRVNKKGEFNSPFGNYRNPNIVNEPGLRAVSAYFNSAEIHMTVLDYKEVLETLPDDAFVYLDPPYDPVSETAAFTGYAKGGFSRADQIRLRGCCDALTARGVKFMLSNSSTEFIREQYSAYNIDIVKAKRAVNSVGSKRGEVDEVVVRNYRV